MRHPGRYVVLLMPFLLACAAIPAGGLQPKTAVFEKRQGIAAPQSRIFSVISDFQDYPRLFPESHSQVTIVPGVKEGMGVVFDNVALYKGRTAKTRWTVTEFVRDKLIRMDSDTAGTVIILLHQVDYDTTEATMIASVTISPQYKEEVFALFEKDMKALKEVCEKPVPADTSKR
jgi:hypothetical protein